MGSKQRFQGRSGVVKSANRAGVCVKNGALMFNDVSEQGTRTVNGFRHMWDCTPVLRTVYLNIIVKVMFLFSAVQQGPGIMWPYPRPSALL